MKSFELKSNSPFVCTCCLTELNWKQFGNWPDCNRFYGILRTECNVFFVIAIFCLWPTAVPSWFLKYGPYYCFAMYVATKDNGQRRKQNVMQITGLLAPSSMQLAFGFRYFNIYYDGVQTRLSIFPTYFWNPEYTQDYILNLNYRT